MTQALPVSVAPRPGESIESWLEHLADANGLTTAQLLTVIRRSGVGTRYLTLAPAPATIATLATLARVDEATIAASTLSTFDGSALDLTGLDPEDRHSYRQVAARGWTPIHGTQLCPTCLAETRTWQTRWRLLIVTACTQHATRLVANCPSCSRPFRDQRHSHLRHVGSAPLCGNPLGQGPTRQCTNDLTDIPTTAADAGLLITQTRIDSALTGHDVMVLGHSASPAAYLTDLRHLTTLLLHLASQPGAADVADWTNCLERDVVERSRVRGPRWALRPPTDPALRGYALAAADRVLDAEDIEVAVAMFVPWVELTPSAVDGPLGWLADRTVMTHTLTRLVTAALAPHRRLSHHLDSREAPMDVDTRGVPQVIPSNLYEEHLGGASSSSEATVRLFASLCLARMAPMNTSWAKAAETLGLPARVGVNCARACSATMLIDNTAWSGRLEAVWDGLYDDSLPTGRLDYRSYESRIANLSHRSCWFDGWVSACRPATRPESRLYAVTWLWIHLVHGHLDSSPSWFGHRPDAALRARYRRFESVLDGHQQNRLRSVVQVP